MARTPVSHSIPPPERLTGTKLNAARDAGLTASYVLEGMHAAVTRAQNEIGECLPTAPGGLTIQDHLFDLRLLRYALASAKHGSFRQAALAAGVQQSSVSKGVGNLEDRLGIRLFTRTHAGIRLTAEGELFLKEAALGLDHLGRALHAAGATRRREQRKIVVASSLPFYLFGMVLGRLQRTDRETSLEVIEGTCQECVALVQQRAADVAFVTTSPVDPVLHVQQFSEESLVAVLPQAHHLSAASAVVPEELRSDRFLLSTSGLGPVVASFLVHQLAGVDSEPQVHLHHVGQSGLVDMVALGFGITVILGQPNAARWNGVSFVPLAGTPAMPINAVWIAERSDFPIGRLKATVEALAVEPGRGAAFGQRT